MPPQVIPECKRAENEGGPEKADEDDTCPQPRRACPDVREPEPRMQRRKQEHEREGIRCDHEQRHGAEAQQCSRVPGECFLDVDIAPWQETVARDEPPGHGEHDEKERAGDRPVTRGMTRRSERAIGSSGPEPDQCEELEDPCDPHPETEATPVAPEGWGDVDAPAPTAGEQVDRGRQKREQHRDQDELDRPAANHARTNVDVARGALGELEALVERPEEVLCRAADLAEPGDIEAVRGVARRRHGCIAARRQRNGGDFT